MVEYVAKFDFNPNNEDELPFRKGEIIKVVDKKKDQNWFKAELNGKTGLVPKNYISVKESHDWYVGCVRRKVSEDFLKSQPFDGAFIVRDSESSPGDFSLSVKYSGQVQHFKVLRDASNKYFIWVVKFNSLNELVHYHKTHSISRTVNIYLKEVDTEQLEKFRSHPEVKLKVRAKYDFEPQEHGELAFRQGDFIEVLEQTDANWWKGKCQGYVGMFPTPYVEIVED